MSSAFDGQGDLPPVSVLVSTRDRRQKLNRLLKSLHRQDYPRDRMQVVVVEETEDPRPLAAVDYIVIPRENRGYAYTRNVAVQHASAALLAFTDDDCLADPSWLRQLTAPLREDPAVGGVAGAVRIAGDSLLGECEYILGFPGGGLRYIAAAKGWEKTRHLSTCNCAYRKDALIKAGGFGDATHLGGEDELLGRTVSAKRRCVFNPEAVVEHEAHSSLSEIFRWFVRRGRSEIAVSAESDHRRRYLVGVARGSLGLKLLAAVLVSTLVVLSAPQAWWTWSVLPLILFAYYLKLLVRYRYALGHCRFAAWFLAPWVRTVMDLGQDWGRLRALVEGLHR